MRPIRSVFLILFLSFSICCFAQKTQNDIYSNITIDKIPGLSVFKHLTTFETRMDSMTHAFNSESLQRMLDGKAFIKGTSKGLVDSAIQEQRILNTIRYKENRSRYQFQNFLNGQLLDKTKNESDLDSVGTECGCILDGDTLKIGMGIWVFGGFTFSVKIVDNRFTSNYWLDEHKRRIFKLSSGDTLTDNILIQFAEQSLILDSLPTFQLGQQLTGFLIYKTVNYLRASDFEDWSIKDEYSYKNMDTMYTKGTVHFTCKVREKLQLNKE